MATEAFKNKKQKKNTLLTSKLGLNLKKKLVKCYTWTTVLCGVQTWTLGKAHQTYLGSFEV